MSIYSGFATRFQQQSYDHCIDSLLYVLQKRIIKFYHNDHADQQKFISLVLKLHQQMKTMEKNKYLEPKSSQTISELIKFMQVFLDNTPVNHRTQYQHMREDLPEIDPKPTLPQVTNPKKKKSIYWVQKPPEEQSNKGSQEQEMQAINKNNYDVVLKQGNTQFRKTSYNPALLRGVRLKNTSKSNLSKQRRLDKPLAEVKPPKNRSMSNYIEDKPPIQSKVTYYAHSFRGQADPGNHKRKNKSTHKANQVDSHTLQTTDNQSEIADIIREYILKAKKSHHTASRNLDYKDP